MSVKDYRFDVEILGLKNEWYLLSGILVISRPERE
jgi:hypothetical protein